MSINVVLAGLIGSILTVVATKILEIIQENRRHKYSLRKIFFEKKIRAIEAAVADWYSFASTFGCLKVLYEQVSDERQEFAPEVFKYINDNLSNQIQRISQSSNKRSNTISLYLDIKDWDPEIFKEFIRWWSSGAIYSTRINAAMDYYKSVKGTENEDSARQEIFRINAEYDDFFKDISSIFDKTYKDLMKFLNKARQEMIKYES